MVAKVIVNPVAGARSTEQKWPHISRLMRDMGFSYDFQYTESQGHAIEIARTAALNGYPYLVAVGGDGTINEVVNGILTASQDQKTLMGVVDTGTGNDFVRSLGLDGNYLHSCQHLLSPKHTQVDAGLVTFQKDGRKVSRFFVNGAGVGFDAEVAAATEHMPKVLGGTIPFVMALAKTLVGYRNKTIDIRLDADDYTRRVLSVIVANGSYFGGGMKIAPSALITDSRFDVITLGDVNKLEILQTFPKIYKGTHITHPKVKTEHAHFVSITSGEGLYLQADGELLGKTPATFEVLPQALTMVF
ncbi:diacylglycerol/lipid kinase family protein [Dehalococcoides mccartyi]|uniref:diacylglycerol/lipid kinase family protein n=1 Tax=Dehalococcoides mccartyi TaxID=61435 RepID=UPI0001C4E2A5|nr:diacylglycerol kinase family protein [Dehalococcoides mccartyi]AQX72859.1 diacylglycerol kinase [Dehalococcoides mccartyi]